MADFAPTPSQREAIENRGGALLVSAAAGSGKTRVLTERLMRCISDGPQPPDIDAFLVITYTRAAAAELKSRIGDELAQRVASDPSAKRLRRQSALLQRARIGTIHSFCSALLRERCHLLGLSPDFAVADEDRARALKRLALDRTLDAAYEAPSPDFLLLADTVGAGRDDKRLAELILTLHEKMQCHARPEDWARAQTLALSAPHADAGETPWGRELLLGAQRAASYWAGELESLLALLSRPEYEYIARAYGQSLSQSAGALRALCAACEKGWDAAAAALPIPFPRLGPLRSPPDAETAELIKARRDACKKAMEGLGKGFARSSAELLRDMSATAPAMSALLALTLDFDRRFTAEKRRRSLVDYSDLEHLCAQLLTDGEGRPTETSREVSARFQEVMVDEYQDVSRVQELIIRALSDGGRKLFMVGDVKQSVYRFRLADPNIFIEKYLSYADAANASEGEPRRVLLRENFRSDPAVLEAVNAVFRALMSRTLGELDYDDDAALRPGVPGSAGAAVPELLLLRLPESGEGDEERPDKTAAEAAFTAHKIRELVASGAEITDRGLRRPVGYGDVAILLRSANVAGGVYRRELMRAGVPVLSDQTGGFFDSPEISVMLSLLAVIDNPRQDVPLIAALRSPLFGFTADELSAVRARDGAGDFYSALSAAAEEDGKCRAFLSLLSELRTLAPDMELGAFIMEIYARLDCMALCCAGGDGPARREELMLLFTLAKRFEGSGWRGLHRFLDWLRSMRERGEEPGGGGASGEAVRIMSIHKSKGLEFPVVFYCDTGRSFNKSDARDTVLIHPELGLGPKLTDPARGLEYPTLARRAIAARMEREALSEELRLIYVAMTRARERLFITCAMADPEGTVQKLAPYVAFPMAPEALRAMSCPAKWLICAAMADGERHLRLIISNGAGESAAAPAPETAREPSAPEEAVDAGLAARLDWVYPHRRAVALPSKLTATEIKSLGEEDEEAAVLLPREKRAFRRPDFLQDSSRLTAAEKGTATHLALRYMDLAKACGEEAIAGEIARLREGGYLSARQARAVDAAAIGALFASDIGKRILGADRLLREFPFTLLCPASRLFPGAEDEELLLQGVADCVIEERGTLTIVDYKTDGVSARQAAARAERYRGQVSAYAWALSRILGLPVRECVLYFLRPGAAVSLPPEGN